MDVRNSVNWDVTEGGHHGQWTRDGEGGTDEQRFVHWEGEQELRVHYAGNKVYVERTKPGDKHFYHGAVSDDGRTITGTYLAASGIGEPSWTAQVNY